MSKSRRKQNAPHLVENAVIHAAIKVEKSSKTTNKASSKFFYEVTTSQLKLLNELENYSSDDVPFL